VFSALLHFEILKLGGFHITRLLALMQGAFSKLLQHNISPNSDTFRETGNPQRLTTLPYNIPDFFSVHETGDPECTLPQRRSDAKLRRAALRNFEP
jgi:hypothetical protein